MGHAFERIQAHGVDRVPSHAAHQNNVRNMGAAVNDLLYGTIENMAWQLATCMEKNFRPKFSKNVVWSIKRMTYGSIDREFRRTFDEPWTLKP